MRIMVFPDVVDGIATLLFIGTQGNLPVCVTIGFRGIAAGRFGL